MNNLWFYGLQKYNFIAFMDDSNPHDNTSYPYLGVSLYYKDTLRKLKMFKTIRDDKILKIGQSGTDPEFFVPDYGTIEYPS